MKPNREDALFAIRSYLVNRIRIAEMGVADEERKKAAAKPGSLEEANAIAEAGILRGKLAALGGVRNYIASLE